VSRLVLSAAAELSPRGFSAPESLNALKKLYFLTFVLRFDAGTTARYSTSAVSGSKDGSGELRVGMDLVKIASKTTV